MSSEVQKFNPPKRAVKACESCRRQKTRCFPAANSEGSCLRCYSVGRECSLAIPIDERLQSQSLNESSNENGEDGENASKKRKLLDDRSNNPGPAPVFTSLSAFSETPRIKTIDYNVKRILSLLKSNIVPPINQPPQINTFKADISGLPHFSRSPFKIISSLQNYVGTPEAVLDVLPFEHDEETLVEIPNIISSNIVPLATFVGLINRFHEHYPTWKDEHSSTEDYINKLRKTSPLLITTIALLALRYNVISKRSLDETSLQKQLLSRLDQELQDFTLRPYSGKHVQNLEALALISTYGYSIFENHSPVDPWLISNLGLQLFDTFDDAKEFLTTTPESSDPKEVKELDEEKKKQRFIKVWIYLASSNLSNSVLSGRSSSVPDISIAQLYHIEISQFNDYDKKAIYELRLYRALYNYTRFTKVDKTKFNRFEKHLKSIVDNYSFAFGEDLVGEQFELTYFYANIASIYHFAIGHEDYNDDKKIEDLDTLNSILYHSLKAINSILKREDPSSFKFLPDGIHLQIYYINLLFLKVVEWLITTDTEDTYTSTEYDNFIAKVSNIKAVFDTFDKNTNGISQTYVEGLSFAIEKTLELFKNL